MHFSSVDFPEPLWPSSPAVVPSATSRSMSRSAQKSSCGTRPKWIMRSLSDEYRSLDSLKRFETPRTVIAVDTPAQSSSAKLPSARPKTVRAKTKSTAEPAMTSPRCHRYHHWSTPWGKILVTVVTPSVVLAPETWP